MLSLRAEYVWHTFARVPAFETRGRIVFEEIVAHATMIDWGSIYTRPLGPSGMLPSSQQIILIAILCIVSLFVALRWPGLEVDAQVSKRWICYMLGPRIQTAGTR